MTLPEVRLIVYDDLSRLFYDGYDPMPSGDFKRPLILGFSQDRNKVGYFPIQEYRISEKSSFLSIYSSSGRWR